MSSVQENADGYVTELPYKQNFFPFLSLPFIRHACTLNGFICPPIDEPLTFCDLGCGFGGTLTALAAATPKGRFIGVDMIPEHIEKARAFAASLGVKNVEFIQGTFQEVSASGVLPQLDFINLHGVYTWVSEEVRKEVLSLLKEHLKPGGVLHISYNALPGSYALHGLRDAMLYYTQNMKTPTVEKAHKGAQYLQFMVDNKSSFFEFYPFAKGFVDSFKTRDVRYLVHEFFSEHWEPMYLRKVASDLASVGLEFIGPVDAKDNNISLNAPEQFLPLLKGARDSLQEQGHLDFIKSTNFRRDLFMKTPCKRSEEGLFERFADRPFTTWSSRAFLNSSEMTMLAESTLKSPLVQGILDQLPSGSVTPASVWEGLSEIPNASREKVIQVLLILVASAQLKPYVRALPPILPPSHGLYKAPNSFNHAILCDHFWRLSNIPLISQQAGLIFTLDPIQALPLRGALIHGTEGLLDWMVEEQKTHSKILSATGSSEDIRASLEEIRDIFLSILLPRLLEMQVLQPSE